jgi:PAS domain S-box-containing protein
MTCQMIIADPDHGHAQALAAYLECWDYEITIAASTRQLQRFLATLAPRILLVDADLPSGALKQWFRQVHKRHPAVLTIVMAVPEIMEKMMVELKGEVFGFIAKPVRSLFLENMLHHARDTIDILNRLRDAQQEVKDLRLAQLRYRQLFDEMPCYLSVQDRDLRITASNRLFKEHFGDEIGSHCYRIYKHRDTPCQECPVASTFEDGEPHQTEEVVTSKSGARYNILTWTAPIRDQAGHIIQVMEMATDITQIRKLQDHLTSLGLMLGSMSHGVKGLLTALDGAVYQLESGLARRDASRLATAVTETREMVDRISKMVLEILYYAKSRELNYQRMDVSDLADAIMAAGKPLAEKHAVTIELSMAPAMGTIEIDPQWLQAALINLVENAIDASSSVPASKGADDPLPDSAKVQIWFEPDATGVLIGVRDFGTGIDRETRERMFTLFFSSKGSKGTGLGLFITHHVITQHGGSIHVDSAPGKGTCFEVRLPRRRL